MYLIERQFEGYLELLHTSMTIVKLPQMRQEIVGLACTITFIAQENDLRYSRAGLSLVIMRVSVVLRPNFLAFASSDLENLS